MKPISSLLEQMRVQPEFKKLTVHELLKKLTESLPSGLKKGVKYAYFKNSTLVFVLVHPLYKKEFAFAKDTISFLVKSLPFEIEITGMSFFLVNETTSFKKEEEKKEPLYKEKSVGIFINNIEDKKLHSLFEKIRGHIKDNFEQ